MSLILNIETTSEICSVGLAFDGKLISSRETVEANSHSRLLTVFIEEIFKETGQVISDINAVAISKGPGSYTGLRIGTSVAKGLCYSLRKPLIAVDTLKSIAYGILLRSGYAYDPEKEFLICPLVDARRMEVYTGLYDKGLNCLKEPNAHILEADSFSDLLEKNIVLFGGSGMEKAKSTLSNINSIFVDDVKASALYMAGLSFAAFEKKEFVDMVYFEPFYLKEFVAGKSKGIPGLTPR